MLQLGQQDVGHASGKGKDKILSFLVANRTAKGSFCRISVFYAEIKAPF
ncbi:hypothetical protein [Sporosarcina sp. YIM B06819]|nr:hypothetical protein [Sporosarcina sp. YIM B06819]